MPLTTTPFVQTQPTPFTSRAFNMPSVSGTAPSKKSYDAYSENLPPYLFPAHLVSSLRWGPPRNGCGGGTFDASLLYQTLDAASWCVHWLAPFRQTWATPMTTTASCRSVAEHGIAIN